MTSSASLACLASGVNVAVADEDRIGIRPVHLHRHPAAGRHLR